MPSTALSLTTWRVLELLQTRVPDVEWHPGRVGLAVVDYQDVDVLAVAGDLADWICHGSKGAVKDGPQLYRKFLARRRRELPPPDDLSEEDFSVYDRFIT